MKTIVICLLLTLGILFCIVLLDSSMDSDVAEFKHDQWRLIPNEQ